MYVIGLTFYLCNIFIIALTLVFMLVPRIPCEPFVFDATKMYLYANMLNAKIPIIFTIIFLCVEFLYFAILLFRYRKEIEQKWIKILDFVVSGIICLDCGAVIVEMIFELLKWQIKKIRCSTNYFFN